MFHHKYLFWLILVLMIVFLYGITVEKDICEAKKIDLSIMGSVGYNRGTWGDGYFIQPGGTIYKDSPVWGLSTQIKYTRWRIQPTLEFNYRWVNYDFSTPQAPIQKMEPRAWSVLAGLTYDLGKLWAIYGLIGYTKYTSNVSLTEAYPIYESYPRKIAHALELNGGFHGKNIEFGDDLFTYKVGIYKMWPLWMFKIGPEFFIQGWNKAPGWKMCREGREFIVQPNLGLRIQW